MKLEVPYYSQYKNVTDSKWQPLACVIACLKVALDFEDGGEFHQVILVGHENGNFLYHEPAAKDERGAYREISKEKFLRHWRHLAIFLG